MNIFHFIGSCNIVIFCMNRQAVCFPTHLFDSVLFNVLSPKFMLFLLSEQILGIQLS